MSTLVWTEGRFLKPGEPTINPLSHGFTVGDGAYETISVRHHEPFAVSRHLVRLHHTLERLGLPPVDEAKVREGITRVIDAGEGAIVRLRVTVAVGSGPLGLERPVGPLIVTVAGSAGTRPPSCSVIRVPWRRNEYSPLVGLKSISSGENAVMWAFVQSRAADEALLANTREMLCEGISCNVFIERAGEILTPPLSSGCLSGIVRGLALEWGAEGGLPVRIAEDDELPYEVLEEVLDKRAFLAMTSAVRNIQAVNNLDGLNLDRGPLLAQLHEVYEERADREPDPAPASS
jgi:branched-chain amino acid aminotransferase